MLFRKQLVSTSDTIKSLVLKTPIPMSRANTNFPSFFQHSFYKPPPSSKVNDFVRANENDKVTINHLEQLQALCDDENNKLNNTHELVVLNWWVCQRSTAVIPYLQNETAHYRSLKRQLDQLQKQNAGTPDEKQVKDLQIQIALASLTNTPNAAHEYNVFARMCCSISRIATRSFTKEQRETNADHSDLINRTIQIFYEFGQTCDCSHGGNVAAFQTFLEKHSLLIQHYPY